MPCIEHCTTFEDPLKKSGTDSKGNPFFRDYFIFGTKN